MITTPTECYTCATHFQQCNEEHKQKKLHLYKIIPRAKYSIRACEICVHNVSEKIIIFSQQNTKPLKSVRKFISIIYLF